MQCNKICKSSHIYTQFSSVGVLEAMSLASRTVWYVLGLGLALRLKSLALALSVKSLASVIRSKASVCLLYFCLMFVSQKDVTLGHVCTTATTY